MRQTRHCRQEETKGFPLIIVVDDGGVLVVGYEPTRGLSLKLFPLYAITIHFPYNYLCSNPSTISHRINNQFLIVTSSLYHTHYTPRVLLQIGADRPLMENAWLTRGIRQLRGEIGLNDSVSYPGYGGMIAILVIKKMKKNIKIPYPITRFY